MYNWTWLYVTHTVAAANSEKSTASAIVEWGRFFCQCFVTGNASPFRCFDCIFVLKEHICKWICFIISNTIHHPPVSRSSLSIRDSFEQLPPYIRYGHPSVTYIITSEDNRSWLIGQFSAVQELQNDSQIAPKQIERRSKANRFVSLLWTTPLSRYVITGRTSNR